MSENQYHPAKAKSRDEIAEAYSSPPLWYDIRGFLILTFAYNSTIWQQLRFFGPNFGAKHIDVACGTGTLLSLLLRWRKFKKLPQTSVTGIDYAESMLAGARYRFRDDKNVALQHADAAELPFADDEFDTANIANSVHCFPDVKGALSDVFRVLKPNGTLAANVLLYPRTAQPFRHIAEKINMWGIRKGILYSPYDQAEISKIICDAGFEIVNEKVSGNCYNALARKPAK